MRAWIPSLLSLLLLPFAAFAVTLGWGPSNGATGYKIYFGTASSNYTSVIDFGNSTTGRVTGLITGTKYYFAVSAYNAAGESALSEEIEFTPSVLPPPKLSIMPGLVTVTLEGSTSVTGRWETVGSTQGFFRAFVNE